MVDKSEFKDFSCKIVYVPKTLLETLPVINFFFFHGHDAPLRPEPSTARLGSIKSPRFQDRN